MITLCRVANNYCEGLVSLPKTMGGDDASWKEEIAYSSDTNSDVLLVASAISSSKASNDAKSHQAHQDPVGHNNSRTMIDGSNGAMGWIRTSISLKSQDGWQARARH